MRAISLAPKMTFATKAETMPGLGFIVKSYLCQAWINRFTEEIYMSALRILHIDDEPDIRELVDISLGLDSEFAVKRFVRPGAGALTVCGPNGRRILS
jgi:hypothetical protein